MLAAALLVAGACVAMHESTTVALTPDRLRCESTTDPQGLDTPHPRLSWWLRSETRGAVQSAYQVAVASSRERLASGRFDLWDSGKVATDQSTFVEYSGKPLASLAQAFWKVRVWDAAGKVSAWSPTASWTMGLLHPSDWKGRWIAATARLSTSGGPDGTGYHALEAVSEDETKWVQVDLGAPRRIDAVVLHPAAPRGFETVQGFGFPLRFRIEASTDAAFSRPQIIADHTAEDFPPAGNAPRRFPAKGIAARYVRVTAAKLWNRRSGPAPFCFALSELEVESGGGNAALGKPVSAMDSVEASGWSHTKLTDGRSLASETAAQASGPGNAAVLMRREFTVRSRVRRAVVHLCGLGYSELMVNGKKVGDEVLDPGFTDFGKRALYVSRDVTQALKAGKNSVGLVLGGGWFNLATPDLFGFERAPWSASPRALLQLDIEYADGTRDRVVTDPTWKWSTGEITFNCVRGGETIDARLKQAGWSAPGFKDADWRPAVAVEGPQGRLVSQQHPPIRAHGSVRPVKIVEPRPGVYVFDLGVNIAGWARLRTRGPRGTRITLRYNESLKPDGSVDMRHTASHTYGRFQTEEFVLAGSGWEEFEPRFTYHGFRYVEVSGLAEKPTLDSLTGRWVTTDLQPAGSFACSDERINALQEVIRRTFLNNMHGIPTDCPQREKMGWMDDGCVDMDAVFMNFDAPSFYRKWIGDMLDSQDKNGHVPDIVPTSGWGRTREDGSPGEMADPWWGGAVVFAPWKMYVQYGDKRVLRESFPAMKAYVDYLSTTAKDHIVSWGLGDWLDDSAGGGGRRVPVDQTSTAAFFYGARIVSDAAAILGRTQEAAKYQGLAAEIRKAFNARFLGPNGLYAADSQSAQAMPLFLGIAPDDARQDVLARLVDSIEGARKGHISAGIVGSLYVFQALMEAGRDDLAWRMLSQEGYPGWLHMLNQGATSLWEDWKGENSLNHPTLGCVGFWLYQGLGGIRPDPLGPGFKRIVIKPAIASGLSWVRCAYDAAHGRVETEWRRDGSRLVLEVVIPANTSATVYVPSSAEGAITESGVSADKAPGVRRLPGQPGMGVFAVGSGGYKFESKLK